MKAEQRHQLHTNALADRMGRLVQGMKKSPRSNAAVIWVIGAIAVVTLAGWYVARGTGGWSAEWVKLDGDNDLTSLEAIAQESKGSIPARTARFQKARLLLAAGTRHLYGTNRTEAVQSIDEARNLYVDLAAECLDEPLLHQRALMGAAQAEESLVGVPREDNPKENRGSLDRAIGLYEQLANRYPDSYLGKVARQRAGELKAQEAEVGRFYAELTKQAEARKSKPAPPASPVPTPERVP
jgi:hypothetical protein